MKTINRCSKRVQNMYKQYLAKFWFRIIIVILMIGTTIIWPEQLEVLEGMKFFQHLSVLHILWLLWLFYMLEKLLPFKKRKPKGCMKYRKSEFQPTKEYAAWQSDLQTGNIGNESQEFRQAYQKQQKWYNRGAWVVLICWAAAAVIIYVLHALDILNNQLLLTGSCLFYIGDLVCILFWCPFRDVLMKNRCCTQCRIYNWDTMMLILPIVFIPGFYSYSLFLLALVNVGVWEVTRIVHPERYYPISNANLQCMNCEGELGCAKCRRKYRDKTGRNIQ